MIQKKCFKVLVIFCAITVMAVPSLATVVELTEHGLGLAKGNYGTSFVIDDFIEVGALTSISGSFGDADTGTVYLDRDKGLGVQTLNLSGSKGISGGGGDQDEALVFNFTNVQASSLSVGLNSFKVSKDDPFITLILSGGASYTFSESSQGWDSAITSTGRDKANLDVGLLLQGAGVGADRVVDKMYVMEVSEHLYVNSIGYNTAIPEPASLLMLGIGSLLFISKKRVIA
ncbi:MAG: PEP-CTERM sorting domain-containing protein [Phycisphaerae bacterium]|nr:PEP-CTERM sorting domain-containing protein [Phycisphaerae bacterium]